MIEGAFTATLVAVVAVLFVLSPTGDWASPPLVVGLFAAASVASAVRFEVGAGWNSPMQLVQVPLWLAVPPAWLPVMVAGSLIVGRALESWRTKEVEPWWRVLAAADDTWHAIGAAVVLAIVGQPEAGVDALPVLGLVFLGQVAVDVAYSVLHGRFAMHAPTRDLVNAALSVTLVDAALLPIGFLAAFAMAAEPWLALSLVPLIGLFSEFAREREQRLLKSTQLASAYRGTAQLMASVLRHDDAYTGGEHTRGVVDLALDVGREMQLRTSQRQALELGALLHDIGKLEIPNEIINKPGKLTDEEWEIVREHPAIGQRMLEMVGGDLSATGAIVRGHHERWDGRGYPDGLAGHQIPLEARIIAVCDSFSAMTTDRAYRPAMTAHEAELELERCSGSQFDPTVVDAMRRVLVARGRLLGLAPAPHRPGDDQPGRLVA